MQTFFEGISAMVGPLNCALRRTAVAAVAGTGLLLMASQTHAVVIYSGVVNLAIQASTNGLYLNVVTGANNLPGSTAGSTVPGWDINLYGGAGLGFFNPATPTGGAYVVSSGTTVANLASGTLVNAASTYSSGGTTLVSQWNLSSANNLFGFRFVNEADSQVYFGWARFSLSSTITGTRSLVEYAYESVAGVGIAAGAIGPVPELTTFGMMGAGLAGLILVRRRLKA